MKFLLLYSLFIISSFKLFGQNYNVVLTPEKFPIPIYKTVLSTYPSNYLVQNTFDDSWYDAIVLESSLLRHKIAISSIEKNNDYAVIGWIDKTNVIITLLATDYELTNGYLYLYDSPESDNKEKIYINEIKSAATLLEFYYKDRTYAKVCFLYGDQITTGWVTRFDGTVFQSCN